MTASNDESESRTLRDAVATLEPPVLPSDTLARVIARRSNGERVALQTPDGSTELGWNSARVGAIALAVLAASIVASVGIEQRAPGNGVSATSASYLAAVDSACANAPASSSDSSAMRHLMISAFGVPAACGAEPAQDPPIVYRPSQIESGTFTYRSYTITDGVFTSTHPSSSVTISRTTWKGRPAILVVRNGALVTGVHLDSLVVSADGPIPLYFASRYPTQHPEGAIHAEFEASTIAITMTGQLDTTARFSFRMRSGQFPFGFATTLAVPALPLSDGWHGDIDVAPPIHPRAYQYFLRPWETISLRVVGRETVRVPAGAFDCWKVRIGEPRDDSYMWVSTVNHLVIRSVSVSRFSGTSFEDHHDLEHMILIPR